MNPKYCIDCIYSKKSDDSWELRCSNPKVNSKSSWSLGASKPNYGVTCTQERDKGFFDFPSCGMAGKQFVQK